MATHDSQACCERPVAIAEQYSAKGDYKDIAGTKCYVTGPSSASKAIFVAYDIFGFSAPILQGADILAWKGKEEYLVVMPDLFDGSPAQPEWLARDTEEKKQNFSEFMSRIADPHPHVVRIRTILQEAQKEYPSAERWAFIGYCWGGKLASLTSGSDSPWAVAASSSPARVDVEDAKKVTIPFATLASKDESAENVRQFGAALSVPTTTHIFDTQVHGWMSARADLRDSKAKSEYERGYSLVIDWFAEHL